MASLNETRNVKPYEGYSLLVIELVIIVLNILAVCVIVRFRQKLNPDILIFSLAVADLTKTCIPMTMTLAVYFGWNGMQKGTVACNFFGWSAFTTNSGIMMVMTVMAIDRYAAICWPFEYRHKFTRKRMVMAICCIFTYVSVHSAIPLIPFIGVGFMKSYNNGSFCHFEMSSEDPRTPGYSIYILTLGVSMLVVVIFCYSRAMYDVKKLMDRQRNISDGMKITRDEYRQRATTKMNIMFARMMIVMMLFFCFSWLPFLVVVLCNLVKWGITSQFHFWSVRIAVVNSLFNPLIGVSMCKPYRLGYKFLICRLFQYCGMCLRTQIQDPWQRSRLYSIVNRRSSASVCGGGLQQNEESGNYPSGNSAGDSGIDADAPGEGGGSRVALRTPLSRSPSNEEKFNEESIQRDLPKRPKGLTKRISFMDDEQKSGTAEDVSKENTLGAGPKVSARPGEGILKRRVHVQRSFSEVVPKSKWSPGFLRSNRKRDSATGSLVSTPPPSPSNGCGGSHDNCESDFFVGQRLPEDHLAISTSVPDRRITAYPLWSAGSRRQSAPSAVELTFFPVSSLEAIQTATLLSPVSPSHISKDCASGLFHAKDNKTSPDIQRDSPRHADDADCVTRCHERESGNRSPVDHRGAGSSPSHACKEIDVEAGFGIGRTRMGSGGDSGPRERGDESRSSVSCPHLKEPTCSVSPRVRSASDTREERTLTQLKDFAQGNKEVFC